MEADESLESIKARYERRLARERQARLDAESIAETQTTALYHQKRYLELIESITAVANLDNDPHVVFRHALDRIAAFVDWPIAHVLIVTGRGGRRRIASGSIWLGQDRPEAAPFVRASEAIVFKGSVGLPGRVCDRRRAIWIESLVADPNFPRAQVAYDCGLRTGFAFPVLVGEEAVAILEFYSTRPSPPDTGLLHALEQIGLQLGRVVERQRADLAMKKQNRALVRLAKEAAAQAQVAEDASRAKSQFLAVTSHEIRTPLNAVLGMAQVLSQRPLSPDDLEMAQGIRDSGEMLLRLLNAVLDYSRIDAGTVEARAEPVNIKGLAAQAVRLWTSRSQEMGVRLRLEVGDQVGDELRLVDPGKIEQTLVNLLSNALKFSPDGSEIIVRLMADDDPTRLRFEVIDGGPGVPEADRNRIFEAFEQTADGRRAGGGGLGLAICRGNVEALEGRIHTDRDEQGRSRFCFTFTGPPTDGVAASAPQPLVSTERPAGKTLRILAAEDNAANRRVLELLLGQLEVRLVCVEDGRQAVEAVQSQAFDLVLMDANMPVMSGIEAVRAIRALGGAYRDVPIQMLTANVFDDDIQAYLAAGVDGVLRKPIEVPSLYAAIAAAGEVRDLKSAA